MNNNYFERLSEMPLNELPNLPDSVKLPIMFFDKTEN
jgi:hypothetical protein